MAVKSTAKAPVKKPAPKKAPVSNKKSASKPTKNAPGAARNASGTKSAGAVKDKVSLSQPEQKPREGFVNPLHNLDKDDGQKVDSPGSAQEPKESAGKETPANEAGKTEEASKLPEGVTEDKARQVSQQIQDFSNLATHLPTILKMGEEIKADGIQSKHVDALNAAYKPLKGLLTPENIQAFKGMDMDQVDKLFSEQNMGILKSMSPKLAEGLNSEKIQQLKDGLKQAQGMLDKNKLGSQMSMMAPFVDTSKGKGVLSKVAGMVDDPNQLGGADRKFSLTDVGQVTNGLLNTRPVQGIVNGKINDGINQFVNYRQNGQPRLNIGKRFLGNLTSRPGVQQKIYSKAWGEVRSRAPGEVTKQAAPYLSSNGSPQDRSTQRRFNDGDIQQLIDVGRQVQSMRGQNGSTGFQQIDNANSAMAGMTGILHKSVAGDDGMVSGDELRNVSGFGTSLYNYMGLLYQGVGGQYQ